MIGMAAALACAATPLAAKTAPGPAIEEVSAADLLTQLNAGKVTSEALVRAYLARIAAMDRSGDHKGPALHAIIALNPDALAIAKALDAERKAGRLRGPLHGLPILVKDNIETKDAMPTTAGSLALKDNVTGRDAPMIARLRAAGALILGKTNLSEWANIRSNNSSSGWSAIGGLVRNPYALDRSACGSSSGTGAAIAASFAAVGIGTETDGSVVCPSSMNGLAGLKPTVGLVSRTHIVPISHSQDTAGPMGRSVRDVAILFSSMVGSDPVDPATKDADGAVRDYAATLSPDALKGVRLGVLRPDMPPALAARYEAALAALKAAGAELVEVTQPKLEGAGDAEFDVLKYELKADLNAYLAGTDPAKVKTRTLADVIFGQEDVRSRRQARAAHRARLCRRPRQVAGAGQSRAGRDAGGQQGRGARLAHLRPPLARRPDRRGRPFRRPLGERAARHIRLSAPDRADGAGEGAAGGHQLHGQGEQRRRPAALRLCLRERRQDARGAEISADRADRGFAGAGSANDHRRASQR